MIRARIEEKKQNVTARDVVLFLYILLLPLNHFALPLIGSVYQLVLLSVAFYFFVLLLRASQGRLYFNRALTYWLLLSLYQGMTILWSENQDRSILQFISVIETFGVSYLILNQVFTSLTKKLIKSAFLMHGLVYLAFAVFFSREDVHSARNIISFGSYGSIDPNEWCAYLVVPAVILLQIIYDNRRLLTRVLCTVYLLTIFVEALLTGSRGGLIALIVAVLVFVIARGRRRPLALFGGVLFVGLLVFVFMRFIIPQMSETLISRYTQEGINASGWGGGRGMLWETILGFINNSTRVLFFGNGLYGAQSVPFVAHNQWLQVLLDTGLIGVGLFLAFNISVFKVARRLDLALLASFFGMQVAMMSLTAYGWFKIVYIVFMLCLMRYKDEPAPLVNEEAQRVAK